MKNKTFKIVLIVGIIIVIGIISFAVISFFLARTSNYNKSNNLKNIEYTISDRFEKNKYNDSISYHYYDTKNDISCMFYVSANDYFSYKNYDNGGDYLEENVYYNNKDKVSKIEETKINNYKWYKMSVLSGYDYRYYYATIKEGILYELRFDITDYLGGDRATNNNFCINEKDKVFNSLVLK